MCVQNFSPTLIRYIYCLCLSSGIHRHNNCFCSHTYFIPFFLFFTRYTRAYSAYFCCIRTYKSRSSISIVKKKCFFLFCSLLQNFLMYWYAYEYGCVWSLYLMKILMDFHEVLRPFEYLPQISIFMSFDRLAQQIFIFFKYFPMNILHFLVWYYNAFLEKK